MDVNSNIKEMVLSAQVIRADGTVEDLGEIQYWSSNPLKLIIWRIKKWLRF